MDGSRRQGLTDGEQHKSKKAQNQKGAKAKRRKNVSNC
jgi:hypothetical protein